MAAVISSAAADVSTGGAAGGRACGRGFREFETLGVAFGVVVCTDERS